MQQQPQRIPFDFQGTTYYKITQPINGIITGNIRRQDLLVYDSEIGGNWIGLIIIDRIHTCDEETFKWAFEWELREQFQITSRLRGYTYIYNLNTERLLYFIYNTQVIYSDETLNIHIQSRAGSKLTKADAGK